MITAERIMNMIADDKLVEGCGLDICDGERLDDFINRKFNQKEAVNEYRKKLLDEIKELI